MYTIVSAIFAALTLTILIRYVVLNKKYPNSLKVFSISVIIYTVFSFMCSIVEVILNFAIKNYFTSHKLILYCMFAFTHMLIVLFLYWITRKRFVLYDDFFYMYNLLWLRCKIRYESITNYKNDSKTGNLYLYMQRKTIVIPEYIENQLLIIDYLKIEK